MYRIEVYLDGQFQGYFSGWEDQFYIGVQEYDFAACRFLFKNMAERCVDDIKKSSKYKGSQWKFAVERV